MNIFTRLISVWLVIISIYLNILSAQPISYRSDIQINQLGIVSKESIRLAKDPTTGILYILENNGTIKKVISETNGTTSFETVYQTSDHTLTEPLGMAFSTDGTLFLVETKADGQLGVSTIMRGVPDSPESENRTWSVLARTVEYLFGYTYNHRMSGIIVDPKGDYIYVNSGARTDHGEVREGFREVGLTSIILKLPADGENILLQDDREWLRNNGFIMAEGIRNDFDFAYSANGDLFAVENSGDRDDPEELNWIREGHHYGFPWRLGGNNTPQQFTPYDPRQDPLLNPFAWGGGNLYVTFSNDPDYPQPSDTITFTEPIESEGPDADKFRDPETGEVKDASDLGMTITTFTTHRSPDGIVFDTDSLFSDDLSGGAFVISINNGGTLQALGDTGEDLLHVALTKSDSGYRAKVTRLVSDFTSPLGIEINANKLYVLETGLWNNNYNNPKLWEITLPQKGIVDVHQNENKPEKFELSQNYPNPFNPSTQISFSLHKPAYITLKIRNLLGQELAAPINQIYYQAGKHSIVFDGSSLASGIYFYTLEAAEFWTTKRMMLLK